MWTSLRRLPSVGRVASHTRHIASEGFEHRVPAALASLLGQSNLFAAYSALADKHAAVNLGQGFPSEPMPDFVVEELTETLATGNYNQYTRPGGHPELVNQLAEIYTPKFGRKLDPLTNIATMTGAQASIRWRALRVAVQSARSQPSALSTH